MSYYPSFKRRLVQKEQYDVHPQTPRPSYGTNVATPIPTAVYQIGKQIARGYGYYKQIEPYLPEKVIEKARNETIEFLRNKTKRHLYYDDYRRFFDAQILPLISPKTSYARTNRKLQVPVQRKRFIRRYKRKQQYFHFQRYSARSRNKSYYSSVRKQSVRGKCECKLHNRYRYYR